MNKLKNYYGILNINNAATAKQIKLAYYAISKENHPDKGGDEDIFKEITEAYKILSNKVSKEEYDKKSKFGANYDETLEIYDFKFSNQTAEYKRDNEMYHDWKDKEELTIILYIDDTFNGSIEYERWVLCKKCGGCGKDTESKIQIKGPDGTIKYFDASEGCDFCDGTGKWGDKDCFFCFGAGKINGKDCDACQGSKRIKGKQKLTGIKMKPNDKDHKVEFMGHVSKDIPGKVGHLWLVRKSN
jgi:DnaJ-class molecular chaperone